MEPQDRRCTATGRRRHRRTPRRCSSPASTVGVRRQSLVRARVTRSASVTRPTWSVRPGRPSCRIAARSMTIVASWIVVSTGSVNGVLTITSRAFSPPLIAFAMGRPRRPTQASGFSDVRMERVSEDHQGRRSVPMACPPGGRPWPTSRAAPSARLPPAQVPGVCGGRTFAPALRGSWAPHENVPGGLPAGVGHPRLRRGARHRRLRRGDGRAARRPRPRPV